MGLGYDLDVKIFTLDDACWEEMIKINSILSFTCMNYIKCI